MNDRNKKEIENIEKFEKLSTLSSKEIYKNLTHDEAMKIVSFSSFFKSNLWILLIIIFKLFSGTENILIWLICIFILFYLFYFVTVRKTASNRIAQILKDDKNAKDLDKHNN